ncbi:phage late control D family protein [Parerythrobacter aestuarii]|uniref:phage late control D family protein n=1 Tax=Parerythrobacter aestuarii TaxID=3020909 RepID=UPI0024DE539C|nr:contractile injection system protein, VgrG/Pvc8 family [Parerythrobacter aestuarii]
MTQPSESLLFYNAIPRLEVDGEEDVMAALLLQAMEMTESEGGLSSLEMSFKNAANVENSGNEMPFETSSNTTLSLGAEIRVVTGPNHDPQEIFHGQITGLELVMDGATTPQLIVLAEDKLQSARLQRRTKLFTDVTLGDLVDAVAQESGLTVVAAELDMSIPQEVQANETDLGFLRRVCARFDVDFQIVGTELHISPRALVDRGTREVEFGQTLTCFRALADLADQVSEVTLSGWDHAANAGFDVTSGAGVQSGAGHGRKGHEFLDEHFSARSEHIGEIAVSTQEEGQAIADAMHSARQRRFVCAEGTITGDPSLRVGTLLEVSGVGPRFENTYYVTHAQHHFSRDGSGYVTDFRAECAFWGG